MSDRWRGEIEKFNLSDMNFTKLVPNIFYVNIHDGLKLFVDCLEFKIEHDELNSENPFCVVARNGLRINIFQNEQLAKEHNPEFRLVTENIEDVYKKNFKFASRIFTSKFTNNYTPSLESQRIRIDG
jgi:hypothetical protein